MRMCWAAFALDAEESGWDDFITSRKSISSSPSLSEPTSPTATSTALVQSIQSPTISTSTSIPHSEDRVWTSATTKFEPMWQKEIGAVPVVSEPVIVDMDADVDMVMDLDMDIDIQHHSQMIPLSSSAPSVTSPIVSASEQQEWRNTIDAQIEESRQQLEFTTVQIARVEEVIKPAKRYIPTKITAYFPSSPVLSIPMNLRTSVKESTNLNIGDSEEEMKQIEILEELAKSLSSVSIRTRSRTHTPQQQVVKSSKPPPIGIGMMMGFKNTKKNDQSLSPRLKGKEVEMNTAPTKITKRGVISGTRGVPMGGRGRGVMMKRRNSGGSYRGETIIL
ncbi:hypothetical protein H072_3774 [Dactylellina haptotyla CBS 200.50]|uniref:Uncharacterized protein n=1 Tax=Dactylellina haptotyla (strain CBS 200.50) TaxID=1284197 RepID=S8AMB4_DACHA|nr:hypothetical protein H072_3774 [Dactylellina haptotyla CBS 200.50]